MKKFVKITTVTPEGHYLKTWIDDSLIRKVSTNTVTQEGENRGTCEFFDGTTVELIAFNETLDSLK